MLYAGLVISQSAQELPGGIRVDALNQPGNASLVQTFPGDRIRYVAISDPTARATPRASRRPST